MVELKQEVEELQKQVDELTKKLEHKKLCLKIVEALDEMIASQRNAIITAQSSAIMGSCTSLRAILLANPPYSLEDRKHIN